MQRSSLVLGAVSLSPTLCYPYSADDRFVEARTEYGKIRGVRRTGLCIFKGIPYGGSVSGANRFKAAPPPLPWSDVRDALELGNPSWQPGKTYYGHGEPPPSEDCLYLNVWTPAVNDGKHRPVMLYNHGGGFTTGSGGAWYEDGANLAREYDVVTVTSNHRLGLLGYLFLEDILGSEYAASGNQGLLDISMALRWINRNIENFGGNPANVMVFGESGGGAKTSCIYALPAAKNYFNKASIESGPGVIMTSREQATETSKAALTELGLTPATAHQLIDVPADKLIAVQAALAQRSGFTMTGGRKGIGATSIGGFGPVVDGVYLPSNPFDPTAPEISRNKPLIVGTNRDEQVFFFFASGDKSVFGLTDITLKERLDKDLGSNADTVLTTYRESRPTASPAALYIAIATARAMWLGALTIGERKAAQNAAPVYMYMFTHASNYIVPGTDYKLGAGHATEIPYKFDNIHADPVVSNQPGLDVIIGTDSNRDKAARHMSEMWTTFAKTSHPGAVGTPNWPAYTEATRATMLIDAECKVVDDPFGKERKMWYSLSNS